MEIFSWYRCWYIAQMELYKLPFYSDLRAEFDSTPGAPFTPLANHILIAPDLAACQILLIARRDLFFFIFVMRELLLSLKRP